MTPGTLGMTGRPRAEVPGMKYRTYPKTDITVSEVGFGLWTTSTGWWGNKTDDEAVKMLQEAYDLGITLFDAADTYGNGRSEEQLAAAFAGKRDKVVYATKFGYDFYNNPGDRKGQFELPADFSPQFVRFALEQSLKRLKTDYIDIWQMHNAHLEQVRDDALWELLETMRRQGKIRSYGVALGPAIGWLYEGIEATTRRNTTSIQMIWNILEQFPGTEMIKAAYDSGADTGYQIRVPHSSGMLEGKYTLETTFAPTDHRSHRPRSWLVNGVKKIETLRFLETSNRTLGQAAIQWLLAEPRVMTVLPNIYDTEQLREFATAPDTQPLTKEELDRIAALAKTNFGVAEDEMKYKGTMTFEQLAQENKRLAHA
jgi:aryl-alcohol dehydrogenase-like predicted oxidoreductase